MQDVDLERMILPVLLALLIMGMFLILVTSGGGNDASPAPPQPVAAKTQTQTSTTTAPTTATTSAPLPPATGRFAKVAEGDTASAIAARAQLTVERLAELNPSADLDSLRLGQTLKLVP